ncbi:SpoIIE family protein phosphatase [Kineococcus indalonis]|uniref:SpoIIE family protein phosphatase n=1 Tax=Kineococcus indalonis TaxID=2696566 RepID=UPI0014125FCC|nr:SpoIIE family protein phosphatase [Kineococcus indalonis]NAZ85249.1 SpoIIE family protein phosphatase [Kineococcus indalonis]
MTDGRRAHAAAVDFAELFNGLPTAYLVLDLDLFILQANEAYLRLLGRTRHELVGRWVFDAFPPTPQTLDAEGRNPLQTSFETARDTGRAVPMPLFAYAVADQRTGEVVQRYWSLISAPLLSAEGRVVAVLQRVEDVSDWVHEREGALAAAQLSQERTQAVEADLYLRVQELHAAQQAREVAVRRLARVSEVALALTAAQGLEDLERIVIERGMSVLGADGGAIVSAADAFDTAEQSGTAGAPGTAGASGAGGARGAGTGGWRVTVSDALGARVRARYAHVPHDSPLPACHSARTGQRLELPTVADGLAFDPVMAEVYENTQRRAWVMLPLTVAGRCLGCLAVCWAEERHLTREERDLLDGFAAQCAQTLERLQTRAAERRRAAVHRRMSETLQRALLTEPPELEHGQVVVRYTPAAETAQVGGDWYDAFVQPDGATVLVIGDVIGHDTQAAAAMSQVRTMVRTIGALGEQSPARLLARVDRAMANLRITTTATAIAARLEQTEEERSRGTTRLRWSNAGHPPAMLVHPDGRVLELEQARTGGSADLLLGVLPGTSRRDVEVVLDRGSTVLLYTDGLVERRDQPLAQGLQELQQALEDLAGQDGDLDTLVDRLLARMLPAQPEDDVAVVAVRLHRQDRPDPPGAGPVRR